MESEALIFIPDISGYTQFVTKTESKHSKHIITELLEVIISANKLNMQISEIEGDAILFYRKGDPPSINEIISQTKKMFLEFHTHLKIIQRDNVCQCGACRTAVNLTLKFISHFGLLEEVTIQKFTKIMGSDVILAHRLLKNNINANEYLLITENYLTTQEFNKSNLESWISFQKHTEAIQNFDKVQLQYILLTDIKKEVPVISKPDKKHDNNLNTDIEIYIEAPLILVHEILTDQAAKLEYVPGLAEVKNGSVINRVNSSHSCVFDDFEVGFVTKSNEVKEKEIIYIEEGKLNNGVSFTLNYYLKEKDTGTNICLKVLPSKFGEDYSIFNKILTGLKSKFVIIKLRKSSGENLKLFKSYCEKMTKEKTRD